MYVKGTGFFLPRRYGTVKEYDFNTHIFNESTNLMSMMFMNMVWDDTTRIGCGVARNDEKQKIYVVVRYHPTITDKSPESLKEHVKPPAEFIFNKTSKLINLTFITLSVLKEFRLAQAATLSGVIIFTFCFLSNLVDSSKIQIPTMKELAESVPEVVVGILQNFTCNGWVSIISSLSFSKNTAV